jgi:hypothetical protein
MTRRAPGRPSPPTAARRRRGAAGAAREGHRPIRRHGHLRRQGHGLPAVEVRAARQGLPLSRLRAGGVRRARSGPRRPTPRPRPGAPPFGRASWVCNVIDTRQSYLQKLLKQALAALGYETEASTRSTTPTRWWRCRTPPRGSSATTPGGGGPAVRRGLGAQGARRQGRRPARPAGDKAAAKSRSGTRN